MRLCIAFQSMMAPIIRAKICPSIDMWIVLVKPIGYSIMYSMFVCIAVFRSSVWEVLIATLCCGLLCMLLASNKIYLGCKFLCYNFYWLVTMGVFAWSIINITSESEYHPPQESKGGKPLQT